jgi:chromosome segregation ATPase
MDRRTRRGPSALASDATEALVVELTDEVEHLREEIAGLRERASGLEVERDQLAAELVTAQRWVKLLAAEVEDADARLQARTRPLGLRIALSP